MAPQRANQAGRRIRSVVMVPHPQAQDLDAFGVPEMMAGAKHLLPEGADPYAVIVGAFRAAPVTSLPISRRLLRGGPGRDPSRKEWPVTLQRNRGLSALDCAAAHLLGLLF